MNHPHALHCGGLRQIAAVLALLSASTAHGAASRQIPMPEFVQDIWEAGDDGLPHPGVTTILQAPDGHLWVGTFAGVTRFDGVEFSAPDVSEPQAKAVLGSHVTAMLLAKDGSLWFGTRRQGVLRLKGDTAQVFGEAEGVQTRIRALAETPDSSIWFGTQRGLVVRDPQGRFRAYHKADGLPADDIGALFVDHDGSLWVGTADFGVVRFDGHRFQQFPLQLPKDKSGAEEAFGLPLTAVGALARDSDGVLWAGTTLGLTRVPEHGPVPDELLFGAVNALLASRRGGVWACTVSGLGRLVGGHWQLYTSQQGLLSDGLHTVFEDAEGSLWLGTRIGLARLRPRVIRTYTQRDGLGHDNITCVLETRQGEVWAGHRDGVSRLTGDVIKPLGARDGLENPSVRALAEDAEGAVWIGTVDGLARYRDGKITTYRGEGTPYTVRALAVDLQGRLWIATTLGLDRLEGKSIKRVLAPSALCAGGSTPNYLEATSDGTVWLGNNASLVQIRDDRALCFGDKQAGAPVDIRTVYQDDDGKVWFGSTFGISRMVGGMLQGLKGGTGIFKSGAAYALLDDQRGALWCSTPKGLYRIDKAKIERYADPAAGMSICRLFGSADGMDSQVGTGGGDPTAWRGRDGRLWFTTATGVSVVNPSRIDFSTSSAPIYIKRLIADRREVGLQGVPRLRPGTRDVELHFAMLTFVAPERVQYKYQLEGYDEGWVSSGARRVAYYTNLRPGRYRFHVIGANHNGVWNEQGAALELELLPRFYERQWFVPLVVLLAMAAALAVHRVRVARLRESEAQLKRRVDEAVANIQQLRGMLPICASCRRVREDSGYWRQIEAYVMEHTEATFSHGVCPECWEKLRQENPGLPEYGKTGA